MRRYDNVPRVQIESAAEFVIYCEGEVVSEHNNEGDVMKALLSISGNTDVTQRDRLLKEAGEPRSAIALHFMHYNFARIPQTLRVTPAMAAGLPDHVWSLEEIVYLAF